MSEEKHHHHHHFGHRHKEEEEEKRSEEYKLHEVMYNIFYKGLLCLQSNYSVQVQGFVEDGTGVKVATLLGKWDDYMYYINGYDASKIKFPVAPGDASLLWKKNDSPANPTRYNLTSFAITLNELTPGLLERLPPTDSRLRPDQRYLENGEYEKANEEKLRLEKRQRMQDIMVCEVARPELRMFIV
ncbi:oxysterol-binding protein-related protein 2A-like [Phalaenopsis equestris]|uniref:oxysterol-binding protein-related protein 2A-like n=1 Tax=Phalaenopsis equestris TaxID=78828 RepID=UPI0009E2C7B7|nr:oxysterol-binding protein-related protein 2A-like [Phalaenopsis equestris]